MPRIAKVRPVLVSAPYASPENVEVRLHLKSGYRTTDLVEVILDDGTTGLGEGYLVVFAPKVFVEIVDLIAPYVVGKESLDVHERYREMCSVTDYDAFYTCLAEPTGFIFEDAWRQVKPP